MNQSQHFLEHTENCAEMAERAPDEPTHNRYKRMEAAWRALAPEQVGSMDRCHQPALQPTATHEKRRPCEAAFAGGSV
jgi:hypothetical protein